MMTIIVTYMLLHGLHRYKDTDTIQYLLVATYMGSRFKTMKALDMTGIADGNEDTE